MYLGWLFLTLRTIEKGSGRCPFGAFARRARLRQRSWLGGGAFRWGDPGLSYHRWSRAAWRGLLLGLGVELGLGIAGLVKGYCSAGEIQQQAGWETNWELATGDWRLEACSGLLLSASLSLQIGRARPGARIGVGVAAWLLIGLGRVRCSISLELRAGPESWSPLRSTAASYSPTLEAVEAYSVQRTAYSVQRERRLQIHYCTECSQVAHDPFSGPGLGLGVQ